jgi:hypothetical protein
MLTAGEHLSDVLFTKHLKVVQLDTGSPEALGNNVQKGLARPACNTRVDNQTV